MLQVELVLSETYEYFTLSAHCVMRYYVILGIERLVPNQQPFVNISCHLHQFVLSKFGE